MIHNDKDQILIIILAAGYSTRMGQSKNLLPINGEGMLRKMVKKMEGIGPVVVILRDDQWAEIETLRGLPVSVHHPPKKPLKMSDSLRAAITYAKDATAKAVVILLADQPDIQPEMITRLIDRYERSLSPIVQVSYLNGPGHPVLFDHSIFNELLKIKGDQGARGVLKKHVLNISWILAETTRPVDLDTPEHYKLYIKKEQSTKTTLSRPSDTP